MQTCSESLLTAHTGGAHEGLVDLGVDLDELVLLDGHLLVAGQDPLLDPLDHWLSDDTGGHVQDPLLGQALQLLVDHGEVVWQRRVLVHLLQDVVDGQAPVLRAVQVLDVLLLHS